MIQADPGIDNDVNPGSTGGPDCDVANTPGSVFDQLPLVFSDRIIGDRAASTLELVKASFIVDVDLDDVAVDGGAVIRMLPATSPGAGGVNRLPRLPPVGGEHVLGDQ